MKTLYRSEQLPYRGDSARLFDALRDLPWPVFLDSGRPRIAQGRYDILSAAPYRRLLTRGGITEIHTSAGIMRSTADPFGLLREQLEAEPQEPSAGVPFSGGAIGYFGYGLGWRIERLPELARREDDLPDMAIGIYDWALVIDHQTETAQLVSQGRDPGTNDIWNDLIERFNRPVQLTTRPFRLTSPIRSNLDRQGYQEAFERIQGYIRAGDCYQVNFAQRFEAHTDGDSWSAYEKLRTANPAPASAYLEFGDWHVLSSSPERFLYLDRKRVTTSPIKGTIARSPDAVEDAALREILAASPKDRAENLMIVDLLRNDLGKVCRIGSIEVTRLFGVESFARVHHLVSTVAGELAPGEDALSLLRACFPGGSITGAPKLRAMEIIEELEGLRRGVYCGTIGYLGYDGRMDTNIAIRTLVHTGDRISFWAGGGIVADSQAEAEYQETLDKAAALFEALEN